MAFISIIFSLLLLVDIVWADENGKLKKYLDNSEKSIQFHFSNHHSDMEANKTLRNQRTLWKSLYGLELEGKYEEYSNRNFVTNDNQEYATRDYVDYQYSLKLNLALFKDGLYESYTKYKLESKKDRVFESMEIHALLQSRRSSMSLFFKELQAEVNYRYYKSLHKLYKEQMRHFKDSYDHRVLEHYKYSRLKMKAARYQKYADIYKKHRKIPITNEIYELLKTIDSITLIPLDRLLKYAQKHSTLLNIKEAKIELLNADKSYLDRLELDLYAKRSATDEIGRYDAVGMELKLPLTMERSQEEKIDRLKAKSQQAILGESKKILMLKVSTLYNEFKDIQQMINADKEDMKFYKEQIEDFKELQRGMSSGITINPSIEILLIKEKILKNRYNILQKRMKLIALFYELLYSANISNSSKLIEGSS